MSDFHIESELPDDDFFAGNRTASELVALLVDDFLRAPNVPNTRMIPTVYWLRCHPR